MSRICGAAGCLAVHVLCRDEVDELARVSSQHRASQFPSVALEPPFCAVCAADDVHLPRYASANGSADALLMSTRVAGAPEIEMEHSRRRDVRGSCAPCPCSALPGSRLTREHADGESRRARLHLLRWRDARASAQMGAHLHRPGRKASPLKPRTSNFRPVSTT
jgi:hypothetical protein